MSRKLKEAMVRVDNVLTHKGNVEKDVITLGVRSEIQSIDFVGWEYGAEEAMEFIHAVAYVELLSRNVLVMWDWGARTQNMLLKNKLNTISDIMSLDLRQINRLSGCGYKTRKEVYDVFCSYGLKMAAWMPGHYWERMNYKFADEPGENKDRLVLEQRERAKMDFYSDDTM